MADLYYGDVFKDWEMRLAKATLLRFEVKYPGLINTMWDDLLQELLSCWERARRSHRPEAEASIETYMTRVIENRLTDIVKRKLAKKREAELYAKSLEEPADDLNARARDVGVEDRSLGMAELRHDLEKVLSTLEPLQKCICLSLSAGLSVREISAFTAIPKSSIQEEKKRLRKIFADKGLEVYLH